MSCEFLYRDPIKINQNQSRLYIGITIFSVRLSCSVIGLSWVSIVDFLFCSSVTRDVLSSCLSSKKHLSHSNTPF